MITTRDAVLSQQDIIKQTVKVPEWGDEVLIRGMTGSERDELDRHINAGDTAGTREKIVAMSMCNEQGELLFSLDDIAELGKKSAKALERIAKEAMKLNGIVPVEDMEGN